MNARMMFRLPSLGRAAQHGFGLVEIMVSMVIGMLATIIVLQLFVGSEARNRTASGAADAQSSAVMTLYQIQNNIQQAGYGFNAIGLYHCKTQWSVASGSALAKPVRLAPVSINPSTEVAGVPSSLIPAGDAGTDTLLVIFGNGNSQPHGNPVLSYTAPVYTPQMPSAFTVGDRIIAAPAATPDACATSTLPIDRVTASNTLTVTAATGSLGSALFNLGPGPNGPNALPTTAFPHNGPSVLAYAVRSSTLTVCDFSAHDCSLQTNTDSPSVWVPIANNIVSMRASYSKDTSALWNGSSSVSDQVEPASACEVARVKGIHLVLASRSDERDKEIVTPAMPSWSHNNIAPLVFGPMVSTDEPWKHYRYRVFEATMPLRNSIWMGVPAGC